MLNVLQNTGTTTSVRGWPGRTSLRRGCLGRDQKHEKEPAMNECMEQHSRQKEWQVKRELRMFEELKDKQVC